MCKISRITFEITKTYYRLVSSFDLVTPLLEHVTSSLDYSQLQNEIEIWLNEMEIEVIRLRPYALSITEQSEKIQKLQEIIKEKSDWFENLNRSSFNQSGYEHFDQLNQRYLQVLNYVFLFCVRNKFNPFIPGRRTDLFGLLKS